MTRKMFVIKYSIGVLTIPIAKVDEKYEGSTRGPSRYRDGNSDQKRIDRIPAR
jgi:hypothetical protein